MPRVKTQKPTRTSSAPTLGNIPKTRPLTRNASCDYFQDAPPPPPPPPPRGRRRKNGHIPRPLNCYMIYRKDKVKELEEAHQKAVQSLQKDGATLTKGLRPQQAKMSQDIAAMWHAEDEETKQYYMRLAEEEKENHRKLYPDYRYQPQPKKKKSRHPESPESGFVNYTPVSTGRRHAVPKRGTPSIKTEPSYEDDASQSQYWPPTDPQDSLDHPVYYKSEFFEPELSVPSQRPSSQFQDVTVVPSDPFSLFDSFYDASKNQRGQPQQPYVWDHAFDLA